jgi:hypothetical protein
MVRPKDRATVSVDTEPAGPAFIRSILSDEGLRVIEITETVRYADKEHTVTVKVEHA